MRNIKEHPITREEVMHAISRASEACDPIIGDLRPLIYEGILVFVAEHWESIQPYFIPKEE